jgi:Rieske Fe-S protein
MAHHSRPWWRFDGTSDASKGEPLVDETENRRAFCVRGCQALSVMTAALLLPACGGNAPAAPSPNPPTGTNPPPTPAPPPAPPDPQQPPSPPAPDPGPPVTLATVAASLVNGALVVIVDTASPLAVVGGAALTQATVGGITRFFLLARLTPDTFAALNAVCTHEGCTVSRFASPVFVCPCHGSRYTTSGEVVQGPAPAALPRYPTEFANGVLTVRF